jgi:hypothetical protein
VFIRLDLAKNKQEYTIVFQQELYRPEHWLQLMLKIATKGNTILKIKNPRHEWVNARVSVTKFPDKFLL